MFASCLLKDSKVCPQENSHRSFLHVRNGIMRGRVLVLLHINHFIFFPAKVAQATVSVVLCRNQINVPFQNPNKANMTAEEASCSSKQDDGDL